MRVELVAQGGPSGFSLSAALKTALRDGGYDRSDIAVAYVTLQGVKALDRVIVETIPTSRWLIGLDDAITQPEAITRLLAKPGAEVRVARLAPARRFHPKVYRFWSSVNPARSLTAIGSGNLTQNGLQENAEAAVVLSAEVAAESELGVTLFNEL